ncbi:MAG: MarR family transcriptional regulator [Acidimicrobiales bacterium]
MRLESDPRFLVLHALRVKGFAKADVLSELSGLPIEDVEGELVGLQREELILFREARALWQLTPAGRAAHGPLLAADAEHRGMRGGLEPHYPAFIELNVRFKELCGDWQLRNGAPNDHSDSLYDRQVLDRLAAVDAAAQPICAAFGAVAVRFAGYGHRLSHVAQLVDGGQFNLFTGVMCGSYHDVWMELHEDLILTLGIDRSAEGSF